MEIIKVIALEAAIATSGIVLLVLLRDSSPQGAFVVGALWAYAVKAVGEYFQNTQK